jgi:hypothetical protein
MKTNADLHLIPIIPTDDLGANFLSEKDRSPFAEIIAGLSLPPVLPQKPKPIKAKVQVQTRKKNPDSASAASEFSESDLDDEIGP